MKSLLTTHEPFQLENGNEAEEWKSLYRSISLAKGFKLLLVFCKPELTLPVANRLQNEVGPALQRIDLTYRVSSLLQEIRRRLSKSNPQALLVTGLDHSLLESSRNRFLSNLNVSRDHFSRFLSCPLILFLPEQSISVMTKKAPDFFLFVVGYTISQNFRLVYQIGQKIPPNVIWDIL